MDAAWIGVVGTLLGTVLGGTLAFLVARWQAQREDRYRFAPDRRAVYVRYAAESRTLEYRVAHEVQLRTDLLGRVGPGDNTGPVLSRAPDISPFITACQEAQFVATPAVGQVAISLRDAVLEMMDQLWTSGQPIDLSAWSDNRFSDTGLAIEAVRTARADFIKAAKTELGLPSS